MISGEYRFGREDRRRLTFTTAYGYGHDGNLTSMTYPDGRTVTYGLDAVGQTISVTAPLNGMWPQQFLQEDNRYETITAYRH